MVTKVDYALLADAAYRSIRGAENQPVIPADWVRLDRAQFGVLPATSRTGFSAEIFRNRVTGEVVISYQGTNPDLFTADAFLDWTTNAATGLGSDSGQLKQAAQLYRRVAAAYGEETISFTGHSLGGGLASLMAVFFDRPAQVFAPAPFESAASVQVARIVQSLLGAAFRDQRLDAYVANQPAAFAAREQNVEGHYVIGEVVGLIRTQSGTIARWELTPYNLGATLLGGMDLHSMQVHVAAISNETFQQASRALPQLLALIADTSLFAVALKSNVRKDLLQRLLEFQFG